VGLSMPSVDTVVYNNLSFSLQNIVACHATKLYNALALFACVCCVVHLLTLLSFFYLYVYCVCFLFTMDFCKK